MESLKKELAGKHDGTGEQHGVQQGKDANLEAACSAAGVQCVTDITLLPSVTFIAPTLHISPPKVTRDRGGRARQT